jgi:hypothetical protein
MLTGYCQKTGNPAIHENIFIQWFLHMMPLAVHEIIVVNDILL